MKLAKGAGLALGLAIGLHLATSAQAMCGTGLVCIGFHADGTCIPYVPGGTAAPPTPVSPNFTPAAYSTDTSSTNPGFAGVAGGNMSDGLVGGGARVASKGLAGVSPNQWCSRDGRTKAQVDACNKAAGN